MSKLRVGCRCDPVDLLQRREEVVNQDVQTGEEDVAVIQWICYNHVRRLSIRMSRLERRMLL